MPIRAQLSSLVFAKAICRKNAKGPSRADIKATEPTASDANADDGSIFSLANGEAAAKESSNATVNLFGIDAPRVADFS